MRYSKTLIILFLLVLFSSLSSIALAKVQIIEVEEVRPGMKGYGLTVFEGVKPVKFGVEVVSVVPNFLLRQSIILIRCDHPVTDRAGIIGGMSGSPIYLEGKLAGALAYGWRFNTEPIAGVTPARNMFNVLDRKVRGGPALLGGPLSRFNAGLRRSQGSAQRVAKSFFNMFGAADEERLAPARTPLTLGGFLEPARKILKEALSQFGIEPVAGGGASSDEGTTQFEAGGAIGVQLIRGDMNATAIGTVTAVDGNNVLAFGHPMFNMGEGFLPVTTARIHTVISSLMRSNKLGSPLNVAGSLVQDRKACIVARTDKRAKMIPVSLSISDPRSGRKDKYFVEIATHRFLTPRFLRAALLNIIVDAASDVTDVTAELTGRMKVKGRPVVTLYDSGASRAGLASLASYFRPVTIVGNILDNPFEDAQIESLDFEINLQYGLDVHSIIGAYITTEEPEPGEEINVHVRLRKYGGQEQIVTIPVRIPVTAGGQKIQLEVAGGDFILPVLADSQNLDEMIANVEKFYPPKSLVVGLNVPGEGVALRGRLIEQLPASVVNSLQPTSGVDQFEKYRTVQRKVTPTQFLVQGKALIGLTVAGRRNR
jgi:SpoIVB peptidase S55